MGKRGMQRGLRITLLIIFILVVIAIAFYIVMNKFAPIGPSPTTVQTFKTDFQEDINKMWKSTQGSQEVEYSLPKGIRQACFIDNELENMYFVPDKFSGYLLENVNIGTPFCIDTKDGTISMTIKKLYNEELVTITG